MHIVKMYCLNMKNRTAGRKCRVHDDINEILFTKEDIAKKCAEIGAQLTEEYQGKFPLLIGVLKGATPFMADLSKYIDTHIVLDFMDFSSIVCNTQYDTKVSILYKL